VWAIPIAAGVIVAAAVVAVAAAVAAVVAAVAAADCWPPRIANLTRIATISVFAGGEYYIS